MAAEARSDQLAKIRSYCEKPPRAVLFDEPAGALYDVFSGKTLPLAAPDLASAEEAQDRQTHAPYLRLAYGDGRQLALTQAGIAFAPRFENTGPLQDLPEAVCFRDYQSLLDRLKHELYGHPDVPPTKGVLDLLLMCIAILDGGRAQGFEVGREERELEVHLKELEKRAPSRP
jgi:hypothetical protein